MERNNFLYLKPMLLKEVYKPFNDKDYIFELKFDGIRCLVLINNDDIIIRSRNGVILNNIYPELKSIKNISNDICVFDGEIVLLSDGKPSFSKVMERFRLRNSNKIKFMIENYPVTFVVFDILYFNKDLTEYTLIERKKLLNKFKDTKYFVKSKYIEEKGIDLFNINKKNNLEGVVAKKKNSKYYYGIRTKDWIKIKNWISEDFYVCGYEYTKGNTVINVILGEKIDGNFQYVGKVIMGVKNKMYNTIINSTIVKNYLKNYDIRNANIISPDCKIKVNYIERTKDNLLREAFIRIDK